MTRPTTSYATRSYSISNAKYARLSARVDRLLEKANTMDCGPARDEIVWEAKNVNRDLEIAGRCTRHV